MNPVQIRNLEIGTGVPKIIVPIVETTKEGILEQAAAVASLHPDAVEWRMDFFDSADDLSQVDLVLDGLRALLGDMPILATFRTAQEGGEKDISKEDYLALYEHILEQGQADLIDVELFMGPDVFQPLANKAHAAGKVIVASNHDFQKTPPKEEIIRRLVAMEDLGADIAKIAVMPQSMGDVMTLMSATRQMVDEHAKGPVITMSMSKLGVISRIAGEAFGSSMTFGAAGQTSAPGQIEVSRLRSLLNELHETLI